MMFQRGVRRNVPSGPCKQARLCCRGRCGQHRLCEPDGEGLKRDCSARPPEPAQSSALGLGISAPECFVCTHAPASMLESFQPGSSSPLPRPTCSRVWGQETAAFPGWFDAFGLSCTYTRPPLSKLRCPAPNTAVPDDTPTCMVSPKPTPKGFLWDPQRGVVQAFGSACLPAPTTLVLVQWRTELGLQHLHTYLSLLLLSFSS